MTWKITKCCQKPKLNNPILIEGLPGIGNVGKVAVDFVIEELGAKKLFDLFSYSFPHSVFVNEDNLVELPSISIYYKKFNDKRNDLLFLSGDLQPTDEVSSYEFSEEVINIIKEMGGKEIITLGGIGLPEIPKKPKVYCTGNSKKIISKYKKSLNLNTNLHGIVGPIVGVSGLLLGLSAKKDIEAISFLSETYAHPMYLGIKGAKEIINLLNKRFKLKVDINKLEKEIKDMETEIMKKTDDLTSVSKQTAMKKMKRLGEETSYIG